MFHQAALLTLDATTGLRAGDALHLVSALQANAKRMATLDEVFARNAKQQKIAVAVIEWRRNYFGGIKRAVGEIISGLLL